MLNQFIIVGRIVDDIKKNDSIITIAIPRHYKNENGEYETDFVDVVIKGTLAETTTECCKKGDIIGVKGNIRSKINDNVRKTVLMAEKVTFLSSKKADE